MASCGGDTASDDIAACDRQQPAIAHGVYGCITASDDVGEPSVEALPGFSIQIFAAKPPPTPDDGLEPDAEAHSGKTGFYQLELEPGSYWICTSFRRCAPFDVPSGAPLRKDYDFGEGPGW